MTTSQPLTFGIKTSQVNTTYDRVLATWREADAIDAFAGAWLWDHLVPLRGDVRGPALEAWTLLAALAAQTRRLRLGVIVTSNRTRSPALLAKMAATVDQISGGRLVFGIGAGGSRVADPAALALVERELGAYGFDVVPTGEAIGALGEACTIVRRMWTESEPFDFDGRWYRLRVRSFGWRRCRGVPAAEWGARRALCGDWARSGDHQAIGPIARPARLGGERIGIRSTRAA